MISRAILILFLSTSIVGKGSFWHGVDRKVVTQHIAQQTQIPPDELQAALSFWQKKYTKHFDSWAPFYPIVTNIIRARGCQVGCEVGVAFGTQSEHILLNSKIKKLYSVDPYLPYPHDSFPRGSTQQSMDVLALCIAARLARFGDRSEFIRQTSVDAADSFANESLDFVYIDADHSYKAVKQDLAIWYLKIKPGGILIGDDYGHGKFPGLKRAVNEFVAENNLKLSTRRGYKYFIVKK